jgi:hypothetical protein
MKKIIIFILIMMISSSLYADFKIMGGLNLSKYKNITGSDFQYSYKRGFLVGIGFEFRKAAKLNQTISLI